MSIPSQPSELSKETSTTDDNDRLHSCARMCGSVQTISKELALTTFLKRCSIQKREQLQRCRFKFITQGKVKMAISGRFSVSTGRLFGMTLTMVVGHRTIPTTPSCRNKNKLLKLHVRSPSFVYCMLPFCIFKPRNPHCKSTHS